MAVKEKIRVRLKSYDHQLIDAAADKIVEAAKRTGASTNMHWSLLCAIHFAKLIIAHAAFILTL